MYFNHIIGHETIKLQIENSIKCDMLSHAHLFVGEDGIGKSILARAIAFRILGKVEQRQHVDLMEFKLDKSRKTIGVDTVRVIVEEVNKKPYEGDKKVIIVYGADKLTVEAQNAFLKTIEEPPKGVFIILLSEDSEGVLETIKSRCQVHKLQRLSANEMSIFLKRDYPALSVEEARVIKAFSDGIPGRGERLIKDSIFREIRDTVLSILKKIGGEGDRKELLGYGDFFEKNKRNWNEIIIWIISYIRDIMIYKETGNENMIINIDKLADLKDLVNMFSFNKLNDIIDIVNDAQRKLTRNVSPALTLDVMLLKMQEC